MAIKLHVGARFLCSVLVAPVKNETGDIIMFIINYEDITESTSKNELRKFTNNRHRSFKLRLPSIRRDIRSRVKGGGSSPGGGDRSPQQQSADPENPTPGEESVPLNSLGQAGGAGADEFDGKDEAGAGGEPESGSGIYSRLHPAHSSIKEEEEGEGEDGLRGLRQAGRSKKEPSASKGENEDLLTMMRDGADVDRGEESDNRNGGGGSQDPERVNIDNVNIGPSANHVRSNFVNQQQASSDSELHRGRPPRHLNDSLTNIGDAAGRRPQDGGVSTKGIILPNVANMKQNVSEKVAQVGGASLLV
ncbi:potassium voltage-gated channel subfamily H member 2-like [Elysia marginata]|uniref:Potassium voltage-gated channel subfamily H member 2-like n=1 Tax=Elysia marginata TaxID=1093978 RepID=A0AAV4F5N4_9GAST|nr:potassium voltage-gated channel subfamily H member 2-like [Elysia marginata]